MRSIQRIERDGIASLQSRAATAGALGIERQVIAGNTVYRNLRRNRPIIERMSINIIALIILFVSHHLIASQEKFHL